MVLKSDATNERNINGDVIRALGICLVVFIHVCTPLVKSYNDITPASWWVANIIDSLSRISVPFFFISSGYFLLDPTRDESTGTFWKKRVWKVLIPFLVWSLIYIAWDSIYRERHYSIHEVFSAIFEGPAYYHLWYLYVLIGLYIATPILRVYVRGASRNNLIYFVIVWMFAAGLAPILAHEFEFGQGITFIVTTELSGYFVAGSLIRQLSISTRQKWLLALGFLIAALLTILLTYRALVAKGNGHLDDFYYDYARLNVIVMSLAGFTLLNSINLTRLLSIRPLRNVILGLSSTSLGIYLIHVLILELLDYQRPVVQWSQTTVVATFFAILGYSAVAIALSYLVVRLLRKFPIAHYIVP